jgi:phosphohistidine phosphatase
MKKIYLVRHGKALKQEGLQDIDRPLVSEGAKEAHRVAKFLKKQGIQLDSMISSPAKRAYDTAKIFCSVWKQDKEQILIREEIYTGDAERLFELLRGLDDRHEAVFFFGHNPTFEELASLLSKNYKASLPTGGVIGLSCPVMTWKALQRQKNTVDFLKSIKEEKAPELHEGEEREKTPADLKHQIAEKIRQAVQPFLQNPSKEIEAVIQKTAKKLAKGLTEKDEEKKSSKKEKKKEKLLLLGRCKGCKRKPKVMSEKILEKMVKKLEKEKAEKSKKADKSEDAARAKEAAKKTRELDSLPKFLQRAESFSVDSFDEYTLPSGIAHNNAPMTTEQPSVLESQKQTATYDALPVEGLFTPDPRTNLDTSSQEAISALREAIPTLQEIPTFQTPPLRSRPLKAPKTTAVKENTKKAATPKKAPTEVPIETEPSTKKKAENPKKALAKKAPPAPEISGTQKPKNKASTAKRQATTASKEP